MNQKSAPVNKLSLKQPLQVHMNSFIKKQTHKHTRVHGELCYNLYSEILGSLTTQTIVWPWDMRAREKGGARRGIGQSVPPPPPPSAVVLVAVGDQHSWALQTFLLKGNCI